MSDTNLPPTSSTQPNSPAPMPATSPVPTPQTVVPATASTPKTKILLLVEDDPLLVTMYQTKFSAEGFQVFTATDGEAGLALAKNQQPDIIVLDIMMPKLDGIEVLRAIRQDPVLKNIPVLMLSNLSELAKQKEAMELGAREFLVKANLTPTEVVTKIKQHLNLP